jgi:hypothetical protein
VANFGHGNRKSNQPLFGLFIGDEEKKFMTLNPEESVENKTESETDPEQQDVNQVPMQ